MCIYIYTYIYIYTLLGNRMKTKKETHMSDQLIIFFICNS